MCKIRNHNRHISIVLSVLFSSCAFLQTTTDRADRQASPTPSRVEYLGSIAPEPNSQVILSDGRFTIFSSELGPDDFFAPENPRETWCETAYVDRQQNLIRHHVECPERDAEGILIGNSDRDLSGEIDRLLRETDAEFHSIQIVRTDTNQGSETAAILSLPYHHEPLDENGIALPYVTELIYLHEGRIASALPLNSYFSVFVEYVLDARAKNSYLYVVQVPRLSAKHVIDIECYSLPGRWKVAE